MKFRYKVLVVNIILLSVAIGTVGYLMINKSFQLSLDNQIKNAIEENNILQAMIEYRLLGEVNERNSDYTNSFQEIGREVTTNMSANESQVFIVFNGNTMYSSHTDAILPSAELWENTIMGKKGYEITTEGDEMYITVTSASTFLNKTLNIINKRNITDTYQLIARQSNYFRILLIIVLTLCCVTMYFISKMLTKPLERLNAVSASFGQGNYDVRADISSNDEVGTLAQTYNSMAEAVSDHVDELTDMVARRDQFVADFTHEIKTPMTSIIGYADTIRSKEMSRENQVMAASYIFNEGKRLETMSHKLFDFIHTKENIIAFSTVSASVLAQKSAASVAPEYDRRNLTLTINVEPATIQGDIDLLCSAFINLLDNARKASPEGGTVILSGKKTDNGYLFEIQDYGVGISEEHIAKICDEFYMIDKSRSRREGGAGLGLSLASAIFNSHNAKFTISSTVGEGTCMSIEFGGLDHEA
ncbi:MAG: HAMP domain-containing histidine kinase [Clostridium sp.]|nr:HAMP domain-containing histidine kinase [Clostridium sp.]MCM1398520.1 HAMP domain-containing histidine kinase [Clostridium sp.]MCM1460242.1 HAMP domain-containing histidine kinase [Bacteroides sp.]